MQRVAESGHTEWHEFGASHRYSDGGQERNHRHAHTDADRNVGIRLAQHDGKSYRQLTVMNGPVLVDLNSRRAIGWWR